MGGLFEQQEPAALAIAGTKFGDGNGADGKHYWLTPPDLMAKLQAEFAFDFDACPYPLPPGFNGLADPWGASTYVNPPFGSVIVDGRKKGPTAWARKAIAEAAQGKQVVMVYPIDKWVLMMLAAGAQVRNLGDVRWCAIEDGSAGKGTGRHIACFVLGARPTPAQAPLALSQMEQWNRAGHEPYKFHPQASHVSPEFRDGWNAALDCVAKHGGGLLGQDVASTAEPR